MIIGFTGTQRGMTKAQKDEVIGIIVNVFFVQEARHGDCIGADADFHALLRKYAPYATIVIHPPTNDNKRAFCEGDSMLAPRPYLERDKEIVRNCEVLIATPGEFVEKLRSGTWSTVRYARQRGIPIIMVWPDGTQKAEML